MKREETTWGLFVDESGDFSSPDDPVAVAGLLVREDVAGGRAGEMRESVRRALPGLPWPLHASLLHQTGFVVALLGRHVERHGAFPEGLPADVEAAARTALDLLREREPGSLTATMAAVAGGKKVPYLALERMTVLLSRQASGAARVLSAHERKAWAFVRSVSQALEGQARDGVPAVLLLTSAETTGGDAGADADSRYFGALEALFDRVAAVLLRRAGRHRVWVRTLARDVWEPRIGRRVPLGVHHVGAVLRRLPERATLKMTAAEVREFDEDVDFPYVFADFAANRARRVLRSALAGLRQCENELWTVLAAPVRSGSPSRTHLAATGLGLRLAREAASVEMQAPQGARRWALEQAAEWQGA